MFKKVTNWCKRIWTRIKRAIKAAAEAFKEDPDVEPEIIEVKTENDESIFQKVSKKVQDMFNEALENPVMFSMKMAAVTTLISIPAKIFKGVTGTTFGSFKNAMREREKKTRFYDWHTPGVHYNSRRPMTRREENKFASMVSDGMLVKDALNTMGLLY